MKHLFIDTNIYLTFYHFSSDDLEELKKLLVAVDNGKIKLYITKQVIAEFRRNREAKIADALRIFNSQKLPNQFPQICKSYAQYNILRELLRAFSDVRTQLLDALKNDIDSNTCGADIITSGLFGKANLLELDDDVLEAAKNRVSLGNPPGSNNSYGDSINWELLLKHFPGDKELHFITEDTKDYSSRIEKGRLSEFLRIEWQEHGKSILHYYTKLSDFLRNEFPNIKLASELEKELAISSFANSASFASTKSAIRKLRRITEFSDSEIREIVEASTTNNQIYWIHEDQIVKDFLLGIIRGREDAINSKLLEEFYGIYGNEAEAESIEDEDLPFD
jgi:predicted nucleic acid-binding protein